jgi:NAD(P)-dependent dehydrogenase (short-subunit alcohol dehydrogenase family)
VATAVTADVTRPDSVAELVSSTVERHGGLDVAVNNAGVCGEATPTADIREVDWTRMVDTNLTGVWLSMKYQIPYMRERGGGVIVNVASNLGAHLRVPGMAGYAATKAAVAALTRSAALEYARDGVRITAISPGVTATEMSLWPGTTSADREAWAQQVVPNGQVATPAEVAAAVLWLASDGCRFGVGLDLVFDGGASA